MLKWLKNSFSKINKTLLVLTIIFFVFGLIMIQSASSMESYMRYGNSPYYYFIKQLVFCIAGIVISFFILLIHTKNYLKFSRLISVLAIGILVASILIGDLVHGTKSWIYIGSIGIQPAEFVKVAIIVYVATYYERKQKKLDNDFIVVFPAIVAIICFGLTLMQPDLGTGSIIALIFIMMFFSAPIPKEKRNIITKLILGLVAIMALVLVITGGSFLRGYQQERLNFKDPCDRYQEESGYQLCNSYIAFYNGGLTGQGLGESTQKYLYLPESYTDFVFPIIVEEWGVIVGVIIIIGYFLILYNIYSIARKARSIRNKLLAYGVFCYIFLHIAINMIGVMGIGPLTGIPLPFLSYGGSYALSLIIALAIVQRVAIENGEEKVKNEKK